MIRVVLDTNVLVAALLTPTGNPAQLIEAVRNHQLLPAYSSAILTEYRESSLILPCRNRFRSLPIQMTIMSSCVLSLHNRSTSSLAMQSTSRCLPTAVQE
jgi:putative PIN family toxin of toxin-antitoxin system